MFLIRVQRIHQLKTVRGKVEPRQYQQKILEMRKKLYYLKTQKHFGPPTVTSSSWRNYCMTYVITRKRHNSGEYPPVLGQVTRQKQILGNVQIYIMVKRVNLHNSFHYLKKLNYLFLSMYWTLPKHVIQNVW